MSVFKLKYCLIILTLLAGAALLSAAPARAVTIADPGLEGALRAQLDKPQGPITEADMQTLTLLDASNRNINVLDGLEHAVNLTWLNLGKNSIENLAPLASLTQMVWLYLDQNRIEDLSPLESLTNLQSLQVDSNRLVEISPLASLSTLLFLNLENNQISDLDPLSGLIDLQQLKLTDNRIVDILPLVIISNQGGLSAGYPLHLQNNFLDLSPGSQTVDHIQILQANGVDVRYQPQNAPPLFTRWYLPAGSTGKNNLDFETYLLVANPNPEEARVEFRFLGEDGPIDWFEENIAGQSRYTVKLSDRVGEGREAVSTVVISRNLVPIVCERAMYWNPEEIVRGGGHNTIGIWEPADTWYLTEGATHRFDQFVHVLNPGFEATQVTVTFMNQIGDTWTTETSVGPMSNWTIDAGEVAGWQTQLSTKITSTGPVAVDRTMYWNWSALTWVDGHATRGASSLATTWHLAEGATHLFDEYILVSNPDPELNADLRFTFLVPDGDPLVFNRTVGPRSRYTLKVNDVVGYQPQVSTTVEAINRVPVMAERAMYWDVAGIEWGGGHNTIGAPAPALTWYLPEGATHIFDAYVLVANPTTGQPADVLFIFNDAAGNRWEHRRSVGPQNRYTVNIKDITGINNQISTIVKSENDVPIIAERAMYWDPGFGWSPWGSGHATIGVAFEEQVIPTPTPPLPAPTPAPFPTPPVGPTPLPQPTAPPVPSPTPRIPTWYEKYGPEGENRVIRIGKLYVPRGINNPGTASDGRMNWDNAAQWAGGLNWLERSDWRLPNVEELKSIYFFRTQLQGYRSEHYWSSTHFGPNAQSVNFADGQAPYTPKSNLYRVRAVRPAP